MDEALEIARDRPDLEPVFLVRFRNRRGRTRVEEVRAYAWPSERIALEHLGYRAEEARLLRIEPRRPVPFPARLYAAFEPRPLLLEELRLAEKAFAKATEQLSSKPGQAERDLLRLEVAFRKLGDEVAAEMWIEAASLFQAAGDIPYATRMLGHLLRLVDESPELDPSLLARAVLSAAGDGVWSTRLYEVTWDRVATRLSIATALGFGLRAFRQLLRADRALPADFVKNLRGAAARGEVADFEALLESNLVWAAGLPAFWDTSRKGSSSGRAATEDHGETARLRERLIRIWRRARRDEAYKGELWSRIAAALPDLTPYGLAVLVETLLDAAAPGGPEDAGRLLQATLAMLARPPRPADRERIESAADRAFARVVEAAPSLFAERAAEIDEALRATAADPPSLVALQDLLFDAREAAAGRDGVRRSEVRRALRSGGFSPLLEDALSQALDRDDPTLGLGSLFPEACSTQGLLTRRPHPPNPPLPRSSGEGGAGGQEHPGEIERPDAWQTATGLLGLAQLPRVRRELAARALRLAEAIAEAIADDLEPGSRAFALALGHDVSRLDHLAALRRGLALTRDHLQDRAPLRPSRWPVPPIPGLDDPRHGRFVMLAWLLGRVRCEDVGSTAAVFDAIAGATSLVKRTYHGFEPAQGPPAAARPSSGFARFCRTSFVRLDRREGEAHPLDDLVVLRAPEELAGAFAREAGLPPPAAVNAGPRTP